MEIAVALAGPIDEFDAELERALCLPDEFVFIDAESGVEEFDRWDGRFADTDGTDFFGLDHRDLRVFHGVGERGRRHPAG